MKRLYAVVFDWAGTMVDHGSLAPVRALTRIFAAHGVPISDEEARRDMGLRKKDHIQAILSHPDVAARWHKAHEKPALAHDVEALFAAFVPVQMDCLAQHAKLIPNAARAVERLRSAGLRIGSTTGYTRPMLDVLLERAAAQGYSPDCAVTPEDAGGGRPHPWMCYLNAIRLRAPASHAVVKIGDTPSDIDEGRNAGAWTIGVACTGNAIGLSEEDFLSLAETERKARTAAAHDSLRQAGAHYVIDSVTGCEPVLEEIDRRLSGGDRP